MELPDIPARRPDWRPRLAAYVTRVAALPFRPGRHDCALFAAGAVEAMTGCDLAAAWRGSYRQLEAGQALLRSQGWASHVDLAADLFLEVPPALAQAGDLVVMPSDGAAPALGILQGAGAYVLRPSGMVVVSRLHAERAFQV